MQFMIPVHEMCKDEARHRMAFKGLLERSYCIFLWFQQSLMFSMVIIQFIHSRANFGVDIQYIPML